MTAEAGSPDFRLAAALSMLLATLLWVGPAFFRMDIFDGDAGQHVWWLYRYADPALFPGDVNLEYYRTMAPLGYRFLYAVIAPFVDVLWATEAISALLYLLGGWLSWKIAISVDGPDRTLRGLLAVLAFVVLVSLSRSSGGGLLPPLAFQRTFAMPVMLLCLWGLIARRYLWVGFSWIGAALFYPVLLPVMGLSAGLVFLRDLRVEKRLPPWWLVNGLLGAAAVALAVYGVPSAEAFAPAYTYEQAIAMPEFGASGRLRLYASNPSSDFRFHMTGLGWSPYVLLTLGLAVVLLWLRGARHLIPFAAWAMAGTGVGIWALMRLFPELLMFGLYLPNRHSRFAIAVFAIVVFSAATFLLLDMAARRVTNRWPGIARRTPLQCAGLIALVLAIGVLWPHAVAQWTRPVDRDLENTYAFIASLPKDTLVAAHPTLANFVPLRSRRSVLTSTELAQPWMDGYYRIAKPRVEASLRAAYAADFAELDAEMTSYGVRAFVTGPSVWLQSRYHEPYDSDFVQDLLERGRERGFALQAPPSDRILFRSGDYYVVRIGSAPP